MIPGHEHFIEAIHAKQKVWVRFYSAADSGVVDRVCAPLDYGPGGNSSVEMNHYWLWDYASNAETHLLSLVPQQITDFRVLGESFDPALLNTAMPQWTVPRDWNSPQPGQSIPAVQTDAKLRMHRDS